MQQFDIYYDKEEYEVRRQLRAERRAERARRQRRRFIAFCAVGGGIILICVVCILVLVFILKKNDEKKIAEQSEAQYITGVFPAFADDSYGNEADSEQALAEGLTMESVPLPSEPAMVMVEAEEMEGENGLETEAGSLTGVAELNTEPDEGTEAVEEAVDSGYAILISLSENRVLASRQSKTRMYPASMTKVMTVLVAAEHLKSAEALGEIFEMTQAIEQYAYVNDCSNVGFSVGERVTIADLFYGTILPSGADAAIGLAEYTAGSQEAFVDMMNEKAEQLGISETTHFVNCVGLYDDEHYSTAADIAVIMNAAMDNPICREALTRHIYTTMGTSFHPDGIVVSNLFLRRIEDYMPSGEVLGAKTGFVNESLNCAVSYGVDDSGHNYICVTGSAHGAWQAIRDHIALYGKYFR